MKKGHKTVHIDPSQLIKLKRKAITEETTVKALVHEAIAKSLTPKTYAGEGY